MYSQIVSNLFLAVSISLHSRFCLSAYLFSLYWKLIEANRVRSCFLHNLIFPYSPSCLPLSNVFPDSQQPLSGCIHISPQPLLPFSLSLFFFLSLSVVQ